MKDELSQIIHEKYSQMNEDFQSLKFNEFAEESALKIMLNNFEKDDTGALSAANGNLVPGTCDVWSLYVKIEDAELSNFLNNSTKTILTNLADNGIKIYKPSVRAYHISMALLHDLRPCDMADETLLNTRLTKQQVEEVIKELSQIINNYPGFELRLYGLSASRNGSLTALFIDNGQYFQLQKLIEEKLNSISYIPLRKYKKDIIHVTLARIAEPLPENLFFGLQDKIKDYYNLLDLNMSLTVKEINLSHETQWMHERIEPGSEINISLKN